MKLYFEFYGRFGNQLFQYAVLRNLSLLKNCDIYYTKDFSWHNQKCLLSHFQLKNPTVEIGENKKIYNQPGGSYFYDQKIKEISDDTELKGFFQNENYFIEHKDIIKKELTVKGELNDWCENYMRELKKERKEKIIGIHIRRGDYCTHTSLNENFNEIKIFIFIDKCLQKIKEETENTKLLFFIGGHWDDNNYDLRWLKQKLKKYNISSFVISQGSIENNTLKDYCLMSKCDFFIHSNYSTFSWWASYINTNPDKKIFMNKDFQHCYSKEFIFL